MNEVAWCYEHGFGTKKDKVSTVCRELSRKCAQKLASPAGQQWHACSPETACRPGRLLLRGEQVGHQWGFGVMTNQESETSQRQFPERDLSHRANSQFWNSSLPPNTTAWLKIMGTRLLATVGKQSSHLLLHAHHPFLPPTHSPCLAYFLQPL